MSLPGLDFQLGEDIDALRDVVAQFAAKEITPRAGEIDSSDEFPMDLWPQMGEIGVLGVTVDEQYGGAGMGSTVAIAVQGTAVARTILVGLDVFHEQGGML